MMTPRQTMRPTHRRFALFTTAILSVSMLSACEGGGKFGLPSFGASDATTAENPARSTRMVERDVEAPEVFSASEDGLWDGRPSLGGVWVAHPDVTEPERVIIRNQTNGKFVIGALFKRERDLPGPKLQMSSDAAAALDILAGAPTALNVTALRREEAPAEPAPASEDAAATLAAPAAVTATALDPVAPTAEAAIEAAAPAPAAAPAAPPPARPAALSLARPFVQIGIFSVEANAERTAKQMRGAGMVPTVKRSEIDGKPFWRVVVGPATSKSELQTLLDAIKAEGFSDAYAVSN